MSQSTPKPAVKSTLYRRILRWLLWLVVTPFVLFALLTVLIYLPPIQRWAVDKVSSEMGERLGLDVRVGDVRLSFPLDLVLSEVVATTKGVPTDTLLAVERMAVVVEVWPLLAEQQANVEGFALYGATVNSKDLIPDTELRGYIGRVEADARGINWAEQIVDLQRVRLEKTTMQVLLSDTAKADTAAEPTQWRIRLGQADIRQTAFDVRMPHDSMRIAATLDMAQLREGDFDLGNAVYRVTHTSLRKSSLRYDLPHVGRATIGFDAAHIAVDSLDVAIDSIYYSSSGDLSMLLSHLALREQSGIRVDSLRAKVTMDSLRVAVPYFVAVLPQSRLEGHLQSTFAALESGRGGLLMGEIKGVLGRTDLLDLTPQAKTWVSALPSVPLHVAVAVRGNVDSLRLTRVEAGWPGVAQLDVSGGLRQVMSGAPQGQLRLGLRLHNTKSLQPLLQQAGATDVVLPHGLAVHGRVDLLPKEDYTFALRTILQGGSLQVTGRINPSSEHYDARVAMQRFPVARFMPSLAMTPLTATCSVKGAGFDVFKPSTRVAVQANVREGNIATYHLANLSTEGTISGGAANMRLTLTTPQLMASAQLRATLGARLIEGKLMGQVDHADLHALGLTADTMAIATQTQLSFSLDRKGVNIEAQGSVEDLRISTPKQTMLLDDLALRLATTKDTTQLQCTAGDLDLQLNAQGGWEKLSQRLGELGKELAQQLERKQLDHERLRQQLPLVNVFMTAGSRNPLAALMVHNGLDFSSLFLSLDISPIEGINGVGRMDSLRRGRLLIDAAHLAVIHDSSGLRSELSIDNSSRRNPNRFTANLRANLLPTGFSTDLTYLDAKGKMGMMLGVKAEVSDSGLRATLYPEVATVAYRQFRINTDNYVALMRDKRILANVNLLADDGTNLRLFNTDREDGANDITASIAKLNLGELSAVVPYMPSLAGMLSGDVHLVRQGDVVSVAYSLGVSEMGYEGVALGNLGLDGALFPQQGDKYLANAVISRDGQPVGNALGVYDQAASSFDGDISLEHFPLAMVNGFLEGTEVALAGTATGTLSLSGALSTPKIDGSVHTDSVHILSPTYGLNLRMHDRALDFADNRLQLDTVKFYSTSSNNPLVLNGYVDMRDLSNVSLNLKVKANDYALINTPRTSKSTVFGKLFTNADISVSGDMRQLRIMGFLNVLGESNIGYVMSNNNLTSTGNLKDMVTFISFEDSVASVEPETEAANINMTLGITIQPGANAYCDLGDGESYVDVEGGGQLSFKYLSGEMILTGQYVIDNGVLKYAMPIIPLKTFKVRQGSSVTFTGDVMNPMLDLVATETVKASVDDGTPRNVAFNVGIVISQTMSNLGLNFTLDAPNDLAVQNELRGLSDDQRTKLALTMLATGVYMSDNNNSTFNPNNALNAFLQSEIQNLAGTALRSVDISLGVNSGTASDGTEQTDYTFQFAKRFWNDRLAVIIGGTLTAGNSTIKRNNAFIDNVSLEYRLDASGMRNVTLFYKRDEQDPLEGEYTVMGTSLVLRRKLNRLNELFIFRKKKPEASLTAPADTTTL